jgi:DNA-directed RNA polymerase subunit RPC12/RpoP
MQWNFPVNLPITCGSCGKTFEIVLSSVNSTDHACPHCGARHVFNFKRAETEMGNAAEDAMKKALEKAGF